MWRRHPDADAMGSKQASNGTVYESLVKITAHAFWKTSCVDCKHPKSVSNSFTFEISKTIYPCMPSGETCHKETTIVPSWTSAFTITNIKTYIIICVVRTIDWATPVSAFDVNDVTDRDRGGFGYGNLEARPKMWKGIIIEFATAEEFMKFWCSKL